MSRTNREHKPNEYKYSRIVKQPSKVIADSIWTTNTKTQGQENKRREAQGVEVQGSD